MPGRRDGLDGEREQQQLEQQVELDRRVQERADGKAPSIGVTAPGYIRAKSPEHGEDVVFVPGELLPQWAADAVRVGKGKPADGGVIELS